MRRHEGEGARPLRGWSGRARGELAALVLALSGCSLAPVLAPPEVAVPAAYKQDLPAPEGWKAAEPADAVPRGEWWLVFEDPVLARLEAEAAAANQDLAAAAARVAQARALVGTARAERVPRVDAGFGAARAQPGGVQPGLPAGLELDPYTVYRARLSASYEVDLFGRIADGVRAAGEDLAAEEALYHSLLLALQADVAGLYFRLREHEAELAVLRQTVEVREESVVLFERRFAAGDISELDLARARAELETSRADVIALERERAQVEHALAVLLGRPPAELSLATAGLPSALPSVPPGLPSALLERRPDIAAAQRRMVAANARIGVAKAAFFPVLNLTADFGVESGELGDLFKWSSRTWALGPLAGTLLAMPLLDGGRNRANLERAEAVLEGEIATYRQTVLDAFREVEDNLVALRTLAGQAHAIDAAVAAAARAVEVAESRFDAGATGYLDVLDSRRTLVGVRRLDAQLAGARAQATVALVRALGGSW